MRIRNVWMLAVAAAALLGSSLWASDTTISVADLHCEGCAKKVVKGLITVQGVAKAQADVEARTVKVTPRAQAVLSPRALWEAVEKAGKEPTKLEGPSGVFTSRPQS
jgi:Cu+-exporting ATPase